MPLHINIKDGKVTPILDAETCQIISWPEMEQCPEPIFADSPQPDPLGYGFGKKICKYHFELIIKSLGGAN